jgi:hypothetical protein
MDDLRTHSSGRPDEVSLASLAGPVHAGPAPFTGESMPEVFIRPLAAHDEADWRRLWTGYLD